MQLCFPPSQQSTIPVSSLLGAGVGALARAGPRPASAGGGKRNDGFGMRPGCTTLEPPLTAALS